MRLFVFLMIKSQCLLFLFCDSYFFNKMGIKHMGFPENN